MSPWEQLLSRALAEFRVLVCGGRDFNDREHVFQFLDRLEPRPTLIIHGAARGADRLAGSWAFKRKIAQDARPADWDQHKKAAGFIRNSEMLKDGRPHLVVAFEGGRGTEMMISIAVKAGVPVLRA